MAPEKNLITVEAAGGAVGILATITYLWWKLTSKFARKDVLALHLKAITGCMERMEKDSKLKWEAITKVAEDNSELRGMIKGMFSNFKKRKDD